MTQAIKKTIKSLSDLKEDAYSNATDAFNSGDTNLQNHWYKIADQIQVALDSSYKKECELYGKTFEAHKYDDLLR